MGSESLSLASVSGTGTFAPSDFTAQMTQSGYFPWSGTMSIDAVSSVTLVYDYTTPGGSGPTGVPEPASLFIFGSALAGLFVMRRRAKP